MQDPREYEANKKAAGGDKILGEYVPQIINKMRWNPDGEETVLDFGCGSGSSGFQFLLPKVEETNSTMYCVDISEPMIDYTKNNYNHDRVHYGVGDITGEFPFPGAAYDKVFALHVFHLIRDLEKILEGLRGIMKPQGQLGFNAATMSTFIFKAYTILAKSDVWAPYMIGYENALPVWSECEEGTLKEHFTGIVEKAGFAVVHLEAITKVMGPIPAENVIRASLTANPCLSKVPQEMQGQLREDFRKITTDLLGVPENSEQLTISFEYLWGVVEKVK